MSQFNINSTCRNYDINVTTTGKVRDAVTGDSLPFANVYMALNQNIGTATDMDGNFSIEVPSGTTLIASFVGYKPIKFRVYGEFTEVSLTPDSQLDPVIIHGEKKKNYTWLWWLLVGGLVIKSASNSQKKSKPALGQPINVKI
jgi:hypothetical protein